jgi:hypothetical protein
VLRCALVTRLFLAVLLLGGCYPVCVTDADCSRGYCSIQGSKRQCIACDPDDSGRPCVDGRVCAAFNMCVACKTDDECPNGSTCAPDGTCQANLSDGAEATDGGGSD